MFSFLSKHAMVLAALVAMFAAAASPASAEIEFFDSFCPPTCVDGIPLQLHTASTGQTWFDNGSDNNIMIDDQLGTPNLDWGAGHYPNGQNAGNSVLLTTPVDGANENFVFSWDMFHEIPDQQATKMGIGLRDNASTAFIDMNLFGSSTNFTIGGIWNTAVTVPLAVRKRFELTVDRVNKNGSLTVTNLDDFTSATTDLGSWVNPGVTFNPNQISIGLQGNNALQGYDNIMLETFTPSRPVSVSVDSFGSEANGRAALQAAIDTNAQTVVIPNNGSDWMIDGVVNFVHSDQTIMFEDGVVLQASPGSFPSDGEPMFQIALQSDLTLTGNATLRMNKAEYVTGEARHGIRVDDAWNVLIEGLTIEDTGGDGIYVSGKTGQNSASHNGTPSSTAKDLTIRGVTIDNVKRNGISVISAENLLIEDSVIGNTNGTAPQAGIDFEPNTSDQRIVNFTIRDTIIYGNAMEGILINVDNTQDGLPVSGTIDNVTIASNTSNNVRFLLDAIPTIEIKDSLIINSVSGSGIFVQNASETQFVDFNAFSGNASGPAVPSVGPGGAGVNLGANNVTGVAPIFVTTDPDNPFFYWLDPSTSALITAGASDGGHIGGRPVAIMLLLGDANNSGTVTADDLIAVQQNFGNIEAGGVTGLMLGDANDDGTVTADDLIAVQQNFGNTLEAVIASIPEPTTLGLVVLGGLALLARRRQAAFDGGGRTE